MNILAVLCAFFLSLSVSWRSLRQSPKQRFGSRLRFEELEPRTLLSGVSDAAYTILDAGATENQAIFYVYRDSDSGYNHGFPSGFFGATSKIHVNTGAIDDPNSPTGVTTDPNAFDLIHGTVLSVSFDPLTTGQFAGVNIEDPENFGAARGGRGYDLRGVTQLVIDVRVPTGGLNI